MDALEIPRLAWLRLHSAVVAPSGSRACVASKDRLSEVRISEWLLIGVSVGSPGTTNALEGTLCYCSRKSSIVCLLDPLRPALARSKVGMECRLNIE